MNPVKAQAVEIPKDFIEDINVLSDIQAGILFGNIFRYIDGEELKEMDDITEVKFRKLIMYLEDGHIFYGTTEECVFNQNADRNTPEYKKFREAVLNRDGYKCRECGETDHLNVHHIKSYKDYPFERFNVDNGITLCSKCHHKAHRKRIEE